MKNICPLKLVIPKTAQETIPYVRVYPTSGVIETSPGVFSRGYLLQDINYTSAKADKFYRLREEKLQREKELAAQLRAVQKQERSARQNLRNSSRKSAENAR